MVTIPPCVCNPHPGPDPYREPHASWATSAQALAGPAPRDVGGAEAADTRGALGTGGRSPELPLPAEGALLLGQQGVRGGDRGRTAGAGLGNWLQKGGPGKEGEGLCSSQRAGVTVGARGAGQGSRDRVQGSEVKVKGTGAGSEDAGVRRQGSRVKGRAQLPEGTGVRGQAQLGEEPGAGIRLEGKGRGLVGRGSWPGSEVRHRSGRR